MIIQIYLFHDGLGCPDGRAARTYEQVHVHVHVLSCTQW